MVVVNIVPFTSVLTAVSWTRMDQPVPFGVFLQVFQKKTFGDK